MPFNHDNMIGVHLGEDLVNLDVDDAWSPDAVEVVLRRHLVRFTDANLDAESAALLSWTRELQRVFAAVDTPSRCAVTNELLDAGVQHVHLATHDGFPPHLHFVRDEQSLTERVRGATIGGLAIFVMDARGGRVGICARPGCGRVWVDTSRAGRRAYCSSVCGNTDAVHRYRERNAHRPRSTESEFTR